VGGHIVQCVLGERQREIGGRRPSGRSGVRKRVSARKYGRLNVYDIYKFTVQTKKNGTRRGVFCCVAACHASITHKRAARARTHIQHVTHDLLAK